MNLEQQLAQERRARLAAEKLLGQKKRELTEANRRLAQHAQDLSAEIVETKCQADRLRGQNDRFITELEQVSQACAMAERRLWDSVETIRDGFAVFDSSNRMVAANRAYLSIFDGLDAVKVGVDYSDIARLIVQEGIVDIGETCPEDWIDDMLSRWRQNPIPDRVIQLWNGQYVKLIDRRTPAGDIVSLNLNITEMMRMWAAVEAVPDGFVLYDHDDRMVMCNENYRKLYADSAPAMKPGTTFEEILRYGLDRGQYVEAIGREEDWLANRMVLHRRTAGPIEQQLSDGRWLRVLEKRTPDGGLVGLRVDITEQKKAQLALEKARQSAETANRAKSAFLANMSHELRTPMNGVVGMAELLCDTGLSVEQRLYAETIRNSGEGLLALLNDVLDYSKIEARRMVLHPEPFDLERTIHEVVMLLQATAQDKSLDIYIDYDMFLPTQFCGDRGRIRQILTNLIGNAVKFTDEGHVLVRVVGYETDDQGQQKVHLTVEDTGIGIAPEMQNHIFGEFNQVEDQQNRKFQGTGLGLAITKRLVTMMGGDVWLESDVGQGACFGISLCLPVTEKAAPQDTGIVHLPGRVMVVDDHAVNRTILDRQLSPLGIRVDLYNGADAALRGFDTAERPDLIITDHKMPGKDGLTFAREIRARQADIPILMLSSSPPAQSDAAAGGPVDIALKKPVLRRQLYTAIEALVSGVPAKPGHDAIPEDSSGMPDPGRRLDILIAEDNRTNRLVVGKMLQDLRADLRFAEDGTLAVDAFRAKRPDLIFMDISMPGMDGKEATRQIRRLEAQSDLPPVPIVALTAHALTGDAEEILAAGLDRYLTKPLRRDEIVAAIRDFVPVTPMPAQAKSA
ncbi:hybrid sensor histidine kinase/response regulator [Actibacterium ureilyticum]|uniref:hybrid sensor histidine kinase/response regulator n=1 Tax=Actibacterium ureilyticum TaxID=1590614 RepID=UPI000BAAC0CA|nr:response regulator [Actibacterium ureilyticum]